MSYREENSIVINGYTYDFTWVDDMGWWRAESQAWWGNDNNSDHNLTQTVYISGAYNHHNCDTLTGTYYVTGYHPENKWVLLADSASSSGYIGYISESDMPSARIIVELYSNGATFGKFKGEQISGLSSETNVLVDTLFFDKDTLYQDGLDDIQNETWLYLEKDGYRSTGYWTTEDGETLIDQTA